MLRFLRLPGGQVLEPPQRLRHQDFYSLELCYLRCGLWFSLEELSFKGDSSEDKTSLRHFQEASFVHLFLRQPFHIAIFVKVFCFRIPCSTTITDKFKPRGSILGINTLYSRRRAFSVGAISLARDIKLDNHSSINHLSIFIPGCCQQGVGKGIEYIGHDGDSLQCKKL